MEVRQAQWLRGEIRNMNRAQNETTSQPVKLSEERLELRQRLGGVRTNVSCPKAVRIPDGPGQSELLVRSPTAGSRGQEPVGAIRNGAFPRVFPRNDQNELDELIAKIARLEDRQARGRAAQAMVAQTRRFRKLDQMLERFSDETGLDSFVSTFEQNARSLMGRRSAIPWARAPNAPVLVSRSALAIVPEGEGGGSSGTRQSRGRGW